MVISTHSAHEDGDDMYKSMADRQWNISTHSAHEDGDFQHGILFVFS